jgi:hypothetical protein
LAFDIDDYQIRASRVRLNDLRAPHDTEFIKMREGNVFETLDENAEATFQAAMHWLEDCHLAISVVDDETNSAAQHNSELFMERAVIMESAGLVLSQ